MAPDWDEVEGKAKQVEGKVTGDKSREAEGDVQEGWGSLKDKAGDAVDDLKDDDKDRV